MNNKMVKKLRLIFTKSFCEPFPWLFIFRIMRFLIRKFSNVFFVPYIYKFPLYKFENNFKTIVCYDSSVSQTTRFDIGLKVNDNIPCSKLLECFFNIYN